MQHEPSKQAIDYGIFERWTAEFGPSSNSNFGTESETVMRGELRLAQAPVWKAHKLDDWEADPFASNEWQTMHRSLLWLAPVREVANLGDSEAKEFWIRMAMSWISRGIGADSPLEKPTYSVDGLRIQELLAGWSLVQGTDAIALLTYIEVEANQAIEHASNYSEAELKKWALLFFVLGRATHNTMWQITGLEFLQQLCISSFDEAGSSVHGSPAYHGRELKSWERIWEFIASEGTGTPASVAEVLHRAAIFTAHLTRPDRSIVPLGYLFPSETQSTSTPELMYVSSRGKSGKPAQNASISASSGYILGRSTWGKTPEEYLNSTHYSLRFGNKTRVSDHDDRGSLTYFAGGIDWITDPGSQHPKQSAAFRKYLVSREAHNVLLVAGRKYDKSGHVSLESCHLSSTHDDVSIIDKNYSGIVLHRRFVFLRGLDIAIVLDKFESSDIVTVSQRWHVDAQIKPRYRDSALELQHINGGRMTMKWIGQSARPEVSYADKKSPEGWVSRGVGRNFAASTIDVSRTAATGSFTTLMADSTGDAWSVVSSRSTAGRVWLRFWRFEKLWEVTIEGSEVTVERVLSPSTTPSTQQVATDFRGAALERKIAQLEQTLSNQRTLDNDQRNANKAHANELEKIVNSVRTTISDLTAERNTALEREKVRIAAVLPLLPIETNIDAVLAGLEINDVIPFMNDPLYLHEVWRTQGTRAKFTLSQRRELAKMLYAKGYLGRSLEVLATIPALSKKPKDQLHVDIRTSELAFMRGEFQSKVTKKGRRSTVTGRVLHVVGKVLPEIQTGYTLRTHYLAKAQAEKGYDVHVVRQAGETTSEGSNGPLVLDGVTYHFPVAPKRGSIEWDKWLQINTDLLSDLVDGLRPSLLHCHSDFINQMIAQPVADAFDLPLLYESRGFWEESWLSRAETAAGYPLEGEFARYGLPEAYELRRAQEDKSRRECDHITTLADVMKTHIQERGEEENRITVTPNGVQPDEFPQLEVNLNLKKELGIPEASPVIGYITSVVEYEGIDTLIDAFGRLRRQGIDAWLLLVGDGPVKQSLEVQAFSLGIQDRVVFVGRVPHSSVLSYYSLIDIFVVPRKDRAVCRLVTPLKPFEAFSTGRTVVMSDVEALQEIAGQSGAAVSFRAEDASSLANVLLELLGDPEKRDELSSNGAKWVRKARSWEAIANIYDGPYQALGVKQFDEVESAAFESLAQDLVFKRRSLPRIVDKTEAVRLLRLHGSSGAKSSSEAASTIVNEGWTVNRFQPVGLELPMNWREIGPNDRTWRMNLHCWDFMHDPLHHWAESGDEIYLRWCIDRALSWAEEFNDITDVDSMAWYDMSLAFRTIVLVVLIRASEISKEVSDQEYEELLLLALRHRDAHWHDSSFNPRTNHGYYSAIGQIVLGSNLHDLSGMRALRQQGEQRLRIMTDLQFKSDGGHSEHSPDYHRMLLTSFDAALSEKLINDAAVKETIGLAAEALGWMIQPDHSLVQFGDSPERNMVTNSSKSSSQNTQWIMSRGNLGSPTTQTMLTLPESGYVFIREPAPLHHDEIASSSYLAFTSAFHSRAHKHCDDNSLVWFEHGQQILVDGGRYRYGELLPTKSPLRTQGFYYADPVRQLMESASTHSTISVDGHLHDRRRPPHGSGILEAGRKDDGSYVIAAATPQSGWLHERTVNLLPSSELFVSDRVVFEDSESHNIYLWWHFDGSLDLEVVDSSIVLRSKHWNNRTLRVSASAGMGKPIVKRGSDDPLAGWRSRRDREKESSWQVSWKVANENEFENITTFIFED